MGAGFTDRTMRELDPKASASSSTIRFGAKGTGDLPRTGDGGSETEMV